MGYFDGMRGFGKDNQDDNAGLFDDNSNNSIYDKYDKYDKLTKTVET